MKAVVTVIGKDQKGIIAKISNILFENGVNILDISQTIMQDMFTMIMLVNFENENVTVKQISEKFEQAEKDIDRYIENIKKYVDIQELTRETCLELIEYIVIGDRPESKDEDRQIHIFYKFLDKGLTEKRNILLPQNVE